MITNIRLQNFRSYKDASFEFEDGVNVIVGPNASGKTNLLEAILVMSKGKSYRAKDTELVHEGAAWARVDLQMGPKQQVLRLKLTGPEKIDKSFELDEKTFTRLSSARQIPAVLFEPDHLRILNGSPEMRRTFLDELIAQTDASYAAVLRQYKRVLAQRNRLLKNGGQSAQTQLFVWDIRLSELGSKIVVARQEMVKTINEHINQTYSKLAKKGGSLLLEYGVAAGPNGYATDFLKRLESERELDLLRGFTGAGPHREDIQVFVDKKPLTTVASRGEVRTLLLALKIIELDIVERARGQKPLLLLDDVFSELDGSRRKALTELMQNYQTFITTTDADLLQHEFSQHSHVIAL